MTNNKLKQNTVVIYGPDEGVAVTVQVGKDTVWLDSRQMADIFGMQRPAIVKHVNNIYKIKELNEKATCSKLEQVAKDGKVRKVNLYNLDMIMSVGYRVNSKQATAFRIWATSVLKKYLLDGYAINERRIQEAQQKFRDLQNVVQFLSAKVSTENLRGQERELFALLNDYTKTLSLLEQYDKSELTTPKGTKARFVLTYNETRTVLDVCGHNLLKRVKAPTSLPVSVAGNLEASFAVCANRLVASNCNPTVESKAAHLLYFIIKDHPFSDCNRRQRPRGPCAPCGGERPEREGDDGAIDCKPHIQLLTYTFPILYNYCIVSETHMKRKSGEKVKKDSHADAILKQVNLLPCFSVDSIQSSALAGKHASVTLHRLVSSGKILPLRRGLYVSQSYLAVLEKNGKMDEYREFLVSILYAPAYLSGEYVLAERGILSEGAYAFTGITKNKTKRFSNTLGTVHYHHVKDELFCGFDVIPKGVFFVYKATVAKALFDFLYVRKHILSDKGAVGALRLHTELLTSKERKEVAVYVEKEGSAKMKTIVAQLFA